MTEDEPKFAQITMDGIKPKSAQMIGVNTIYPFNLFAWNYPIVYLNQS